MMLIQSADRIYMLDRNNDVFQIHHLNFPKDAHCNEHLINTLVDGVCVETFSRFEISFLWRFRNLLLIMTMASKYIDI